MALERRASPADSVTSSPVTSPLDIPGATPMMAQYIEIKAANPDCLLFYRMGDFYELFFEDAEIASRALGIVLTKRGKHGGADIPMCGVPLERADDYLHRLIALGHRVAVCQQTEDAAEAKKRGPKSVVRREVIRLVTPGTLTEDRLLDPTRANLLLAIGRRKVSDTRDAYGLAALDISTGRFSLSEVEGSELAAAISKGVCTACRLTVSSLVSTSLTSSSSETLRCASLVCVSCRAKSLASLSASLASQ